jgi:catechol 2,3-dioxygenase
MACDIVLSVLSSPAHVGAAFRVAAATSRVAPARTSSLLGPEEKTMPASVSKIGHIVLKVEDVDSAVSFYCGVLGLKEVARRDFGEGPMTFLSTGNSHHDVALVTANPPNSGPGSLHHFALKVGESLQDLRHVKQALAAEGIVVHMSLDHRVSQGIYISDPDGNLIELYVDADEKLWRHDPSLVANSDPLNL